MMRELLPGYGYASAVVSGAADEARRIEHAGQASLRRKFAPEFLNRIDATLTYRPLGRDSLESILDLQIAGLDRLLIERLGSQAFALNVSAEAREFLLDRGSAPEYGARELRRTIERHLVHPLAARIARDEIPPACMIRVSVSGCRTRLEFQEEDECKTVMRASRRRAAESDRAAA